MFLRETVAIFHFTPLYIKIQSLSFRLFINMMMNLIFFECLNKQHCGLYRSKWTWARFGEILIVYTNIFVLLALMSVRSNHLIEKMHRKQETNHSKTR